MTKSKVQLKETVHGHVAVVVAQPVELKAIVIEFGYFHILFRLNILFWMRPTACWRWVLKIP